MTVAQAIKLLQKMPPQAEITVGCAAEPVREIVLEHDENGDFAAVRS